MKRLVGMLLLGTLVWVAGALGQSGFTIATDRQVYQLGDEVVVTLTYHNESDTSVIFSFSNTCHDHFSVDGIWSNDAYRECRNVAGHETVFSGGTAQWVTTVVSEHLTPGRYTVSGWIDGPSGSDTTHGFSQTTFFVDSTFTYRLSAKWNMISYPFTRPLRTVREIFPHHNSKGFRYEHGYISEDTLRPGFGYWIKVSVPETVTISGSPTTHLNTVIHSGWNMVGSLGVALPVQNIFTLPYHSPIRWYVRRFGYYVNAPTTLPGEVGWFKTFSEGRLIMDIGNGTADR